MARYLTTALLGILLLGVLAGTATAQSAAETRFREFDVAPANGKVSLDEFVGAKEGTVREAASREFSNLDTDASNSLSLEEYEAGQTDWVRVLTMCAIVLAVIVLPFVVGSFLANMLQMPDYALRLGVVLFASTVGSVLVIGGWPPKLGPDLQGGVILVYEIDKGKRINDFRPKVIDQVAEAIEIRTNDRLAVAEGEGSLIEVRVPRQQRSEIVGKINGLELDFGVQLTNIGEKKDVDHPDSVILVYEMTLDDFRPKIISDIQEKIGKDDPELSITTSGSTQIEVSVPQEQRKEIVDLIQRMDFSSLGASLSAVDEEEVGDDVVLRYEIDNLQQTGEIDKLIPQLGSRLNPGGVKEVSVRKRGSEQVEIIVPGVEGPAIDEYQKVIETAGVLKFRIVPTLLNDTTGLAERALKTKGNTVYNGERPEALWVKHGDDDDTGDMITRRNAKDELEVLVLLDRFDVKGEDLGRTMSSYDQMGRPAVNFSMKPGAASRFGELTEQNIGKLLGIVLDDELMSAATIKSRISDSGEITGRFTQERVDFVVGILEAGALSADLNKQPISREEIGPQLGEATIKASTQAMVAATALVVFFMIAYYRFAGVIACLALALNLLLVVAIMILVGYEFTLAGFAGLVLTVGMAVDANVLIFERMREEIDHGAALRMAIRNGFAKAMSTIVDSNLTTLIIAIVLFWIGTEQVKGFAVTLFLGITINMFTAVYCSRVLFDIAEKKRLISKLSMARVIHTPNIDFVGMRFAGVVVPIVLITIGIIATYMRGPGLLDIDFTGGTAVTVYFEEDQPLDVAEVRRLAAENLDDTQVSRVQIAGEKPDLRYKIDTSDRDLAHVRRNLFTAFGSRLRTIRMDYEALVAVELESDDAPIEAEAAPAEKNIDEESKITPKEPVVQPQPKDDTTNGDDTSKEKEKNKAKESTPNEDPQELDPPSDETSPEDEVKGDAAEVKDGEVKDAQPKEPNKDDGASRGSLRGLALGPAAVLALLQAEGEEEPTKNDDSKDTEPAPADKKEATAPTGDAPATDENESDENESQPIGNEPVPSDDSGTKDAEAPETTKDTSAADRESSAKSKVGSKTKLTLSEKISHPSLMAVFENARKKLEEQEKSVYTQEHINVTFSHPDYSPGSNVGYTDWTFEVDLPPEQAKPLLDEMAARLASEPIFPSTSNISGRVTEEMQWKAITSILVSLVFMVAYIWIRFQNLVYGLAATAALVHDVLIMLGCIAISAYVAPFLGFLLIEPFKINLTIVAAFLTIVGYSINDTIVTFDRIREVRGKSPDLTREMVNASINQTLSRTILTASTVLIVVLILYIFGGPSIHAFAFALVIGSMAGVYSTIFIAAQIVYAIVSRQKAVAVSASAQRRAASAN